jgi:formate hydrogenlyase transcriptional activator
MCSKPQPQLDTRLLRAIQPAPSKHPERSIAVNESCAAISVGPESLRDVDAWLFESILANAAARAETDASLREARHAIEELQDRIEKGNTHFPESVSLGHRSGGAIGNSEGFRCVLRKVEQVAPTDSTVLLLGETGTGKELMSCKIHELSRRRDRTMVKVNCAALPASLIESELFGRERGAFTGALTRELGRFDLSNGSTILLDEIGELPLELQTKLLRVLQEGEFERLGSSKTIKVDARVIAATSRNLAEAVRAGKFREDLFYRLNVFPITIPPLRERREDIPLLVWHFVRVLGQRMGRVIESIQTSTMQAFQNYSWPGNVRELSNVIERSLITTTDGVFRADVPAANKPLATTRTETLEEIERSHILRILAMVDWRVRGVGGAAQILCLKPARLQFLMRKLGIARQQ